MSTKGNSAKCLRDLKKRSGTKFYLWHHKASQESSDIALEVPKHTFLGLTPSSVLNDAGRSNEVQRRETGSAAVCKANKCLTCCSISWTPRTCWDGSLALYPLWTYHLGVHSLTK